MPRVPDARVLQQVVNQLLHPFGAVDGEADELLRVAVELVLVALGQELRVVRDHAQRLLKIVGGHVGELLQLLVRSREFLGLGLERTLGSACVAVMSRTIAVNNRPPCVLTQLEREISRGNSLPSLRRPVVSNVVPMPGSPSGAR